MWANNQQAFLVLRGKHRQQVSRRWKIRALCWGLAKQELQRGPPGAPRAARPTRAAGPARRRRARSRGTRSARPHPICQATQTSVGSCAVPSEVCLHWHVPVQRTPARGHQTAWRSGDRNDCDSRQRCRDTHAWLPTGAACKGGMHAALSVLTRCSARASAPHEGLGRTALVLCRAPRLRCAPQAPGGRIHLREERIALVVCLYLHTVPASASVSARIANKRKERLHVCACTAGRAGTTNPLVGDRA